MSAGLLVRDQRDGVLIVQPTYKPILECPGGITEANESPRATVRREVLEELNLPLEPGRLLVVDYTTATDTKTEALHFIFDGGRLEPHQVAAIRLPADELEWFRFVPRRNLETLMTPSLATRLSGAWEALEAGETWYLEDGGRVG
jgi:8-oxo-dGTP diphosphatase